ncbi:hypothetical protein RB598_007424 [Gaeumannomyces tritici]
MKTATISLDDLPLELLQRIAASLGATHRPSLCALAVSNSSWHRASLPFLLRDIRFAVSDPETLRSRIDAGSKTLSDSAHLVRHLHIEGFLNLTPRQRTRDSAEHIRRTGIADIFGADMPILHRYTDSDEEAVMVSAEEDAAWRPLVGLVKSLPHLAKLSYDCSNQFPPSLLDAVHKHHPRCKLHILSFHLWSLTLEQPDPHEMALATSPCLHSIKCWYTHPERQARHKFNENVIMDLIASLAPNLKEVRLVGVSPSTSLSGMFAPTHVWPGLPGFDGGNATKASLTHWSHAGLVPINSGSLQKWDRRIDFDHLQHLDVGGGYQAPSRVSAEALEWFSLNHSFPQLKTLRLHLEHDVSGAGPDHNETTSSFFGALEPLEELDVSGPLTGEILDRILSRHGPTLTSFGFCPIERYGRPQPGPMSMVLRKDHIMKIQAACPRLEHLAVPIRRTKSDPRETELYRSLGKFRRLRSLFLRLDCSSPHAVPPSAESGTPDYEEDYSLFDGYDRNPFWSASYIRCGDVRKALEKSAVDETLARSVWHVICGAKEGARLRWLKLHPDGGWSFGIHGTAPYAMRRIVSNLSRSWLVERGVRDDEAEDDAAIRVRELGREAREARDRDYDVQSPHACIWREYSAIDIFHRIWPLKGPRGGASWRQAWSSFPLAP